jgi:hypothetical protein
MFRLLNAVQQKISDDFYFLHMFLLLSMLYLFKINFFRESVDFVLDELRAYEKGTDTYIIDGHFMPYSRWDNYEYINESTVNFATAL